MLGCVEERQSTFSSFGVTSTLAVMTQALMVIRQSISRAACKSVIRRRVHHVKSAEQNARSAAGARNIVVHLPIIHFVALPFSKDQSVTHAVIWRTGWICRGSRVFLAVCIALGCPYSLASFVCSSFGFLHRSQYAASTH